MNNFLSFKNEKKRSFISRKWRKRGLKKQSIMNSDTFFHNKNKSHLYQEDGRNKNWNSKVWWITSSASSTKTKVIDVKKMWETWIEIAKCYEKLPLLKERKQKSFMSRKKQKHGLKWQSVINNFFYFHNENKNHLFQQNEENMDGISKVLLITSPDSRTKRKVIYVKKKKETWLEIAKCDE